MASRTREQCGTYSLTRERRVAKASGWMERMAFQLRSLWAERGTGGTVTHGGLSVLSLGPPSPTPVWAAPRSSALGLLRRHLLPGSRAGCCPRERDVAAWPQSLVALGASWRSGMRSHLDGEAPLLCVCWGWGLGVGGLCACHQHACQACEHVWEGVGPEGRGVLTGPAGRSAG